jgi:succinate dehydrogenase / fumarate reductase cytochrome b subunit
MASDAKQKRLFNTSVFKKFLSALTGILLCLYLVAHLAGNFLLFAGKGVFNAYGNFLTGLPFLPIIELALLSLFLAHIYTGLRVWRENKRARPDDYAVKRWTRDEKYTAGPHKSRKGVTSTLMGISGVITLAFLVYHVIHFKYGRYIPLGPEGKSTTPVASTARASLTNETRVTSPNGATPKADSDRTETMSEGEHEGKGRDLAQLLLEEFKKPWIVAIYVGGMLLLGMHLNHGVSSAFQSMGVGGYGKLWFILGRAFTIIIIGGFIIIPLWVLFVHPPVEPTAAQKAQQAQTSTRSSSTATAQTAAPQSAR